MKTRLAYYKCRNPQTNTQLNLNLLHQIERLTSSSSRSLSTLLAVGEHVPIPQQPQVSEITQVTGTNTAFLHHPFNTLGNGFSSILLPCWNPNFSSCIFGCSYIKLQELFTAPLTQNLSRLNLYIQTWVAVPNLFQILNGTNQRGGKFSTCTASCVYEAGIWNSCVNE